MPFTPIPIPYRVREVLRNLIKSCHLFTGSDTCKNSGNRHEVHSRSVNKIAYTNAVNIFISDDSNVRLFIGF